jgi:hypothetical protein
MSITPVLPNLHEYPILFTLIVIGALCAGGLILTYLFQVMGEVVIAYYGFRAKSADARARFQQSINKRGRDTG